MKQLIVSSIYNDDYEPLEFSAETDFHIIQSFIIQSDGSLDFPEDEQDYQSYPETDYSVESEFGSEMIEVTDAISISENLWEIFESPEVRKKLPTDPGTYVMEGMLNTPVHVYNIDYVDNSNKYEVDIEYIYDRIDIDIDWENSNIEVIRIQKQS